MKSSRRNLMLELIEPLALGCKRKYRIVLREALGPFGKRRLRETEQAFEGQRRETRRRVGPS